MKLSPHFTLAEMTKSQTALRLGLDNIPSQQEIKSLTTLCVEVLEPVRAEFERPVIISSGFRAPAVNAAIGSRSTSQHCKGEAADIEIPGVDNFAVYTWLGETVGFDQLILEFYTDGEPMSGWVHVSYVSSDANRGERLRINKAGVRHD